MSAHEDHDRAERAEAEVAQLNNRIEHLENRLRIEFETSVTTAEQMREQQTRAERAEAARDTAIQNAANLATEVTNLKANLDRERDERLIDLRAAREWKVRAERAEAALAEAKDVILNVHDDLAQTTWECPKCGHSEPTSDMDVMGIWLKPAARAYRAAMEAKGEKS